MNNIRPATMDDLPRIAEIEVFNYRLNFYPIFRSDEYYFDEMTVPKLMTLYSGARGKALDNDRMLLSQ